ncbi:MAG TPA: discoidin domain-containing protein, partial [Pyrinomonadaceae bacterium]
TDDSLRFCLQDGAKLVNVSDRATPPLNLAETLREDSTAERHEPEPTVKFNLGQAPTAAMRNAALTVPVRSNPSTRETEQLERATVEKSKTLRVAVLTAVIVLAVVAAGFGVVYLLSNKNSGNTNANAGTKSENGGSTNRGSTPSATNTGNRNVNQANANVAARAGAPATITATASSTRAPEKENTYVASNVLDGSLLTAWTEGAPGPGVGEWIRCDFDREATLRRILITPGYFKSPALWSQNNRLAVATFSFSDGTSRRFTFPDRMEEQRLDVGKVKTRWVRMVIQDIYPGSADSEDTPISQLTFEFE